MTAAILAAVLLLGIPNAATEMRAAAIDSVDLQPSHWRYISLYAAEDPGQQGRVASFCMNSVSRADEIHQPKQIQGQTLVRINLADYSREETLPALLAAWERLGETEPYFTIRTTQLVPYVRKDRYGRIVERFNKRIETATPVHPSAYKTLQRQCLGTCLPVVRADWLITNSMAVPGTYYDLLGAPKTIQEFSQQLEVDLKRLLESTSTKAANILKRKPTRKPGRVFAINAPNGIFTLAQDINNDADPHRDPFRNPGQFVFDGSEIVAALPNKMLGFYLADGKGNRIDAVPQEVAPYDYSAPLEAVEAPVAVGLSCITCHNQSDERGFKEFVNDQAWILDSIKRYEKDPQKLRDLLSRYDTSFIGDRLLLAGAEAESACEKSTGWTMKQAASGLREEVTLYRDTPVTTEQACIEWGCTAGELKAAMSSDYAKKLAATNQIGEPYAFSLAQGIPCSRGAFESGTYSFGWQVLYPQEYE